MNSADIDDRRMFQRREDDGGRPSLAKLFAIALAVISLCGSVFTAGYNWRSVAILESNQENFVRKDVQGEQLRNVNDRLAEIVRQNDRLAEVVRQLEELRARDARRKD